MVITVAVGLTWAGCASAPATLSPVGPNPMEYSGPGSEGQLEVFSALSGHREGENPTWYRRTDYELCNAQGQRLQHVPNFVSHYSQAPQLILLPPGEYIVEARAKGILWVRVPVVIKAGARTSVHLDGAWQPSAEPSQLVSAPAGYPVGWRTDAQ